MRMEKINEIRSIFPSARSERCEPCNHSKIISCNGRFRFLGCTHTPYKGKWVVEIKDCPKDAKKGGETDD